MEKIINPTQQIKIALDAMGGDLAPEMAVKGAVLASRDYQVPIILVGDENAIKAELAKQNALDVPFEFRHASESIEMGEKPQAMIKKKKNSSLRIAFELVKSGEAQAIVSAGNSGALLYGALFVLKRLKLVSRPGIAARMPSLHGTVVIIDAGANAVCKPENLVEFAIMGSSYFKHVFGVRKPRVGVLSNGEEDTKGTDLTRDTHEQLKKGGLNYIGYVEGRDLFSGDVDVIVCDGFTGNIVIKTTEGVAHNLTTLLRGELRRSLLSKLGYLLARKSFMNFRKRLDYREYGGALLLGVDAPVVFAHGSSNERAFMNALRVAYEYAERDIVTAIRKDLEQNEELFASKKRRPLIDRILRPFSRKETDGEENTEEQPQETADKTEEVLPTEKQEAISSPEEPEAGEEPDKQNDDQPDPTEKQ